MGILTSKIRTVTEQRVADEALAILQLIAVLLESLGFAASTLATSPNRGERRFSAKRLAVAFAPLTFLFIAIPVMFWLAYWRAEVNQLKEEKTQTTAATTADSLAEHIDENGRLEHQEKCNEIDAWRRNLLVEYSESELIETLIVRSVGIDGKPRMFDDIIEKRQNVLPIADVDGSNERCTEL
jgi:hypothetical protein